MVQLWLRVRYPQALCWHEQVGVMWFFSHARGFCVPWLKLTYCKHAAELEGCRCLCLPPPMIASVQLRSCSYCHFKSWCAGLQCIRWLFSWEIKQWQFCTRETVFSWREELWGNAKGSPTWWLCAVSCAHCHRLHIVTLVAFLHLCFSSNRKQLVCKHTSTWLAEGKQQHLDAFSFC